MTKLRATFLYPALFLFAVVAPLKAQQELPINVKSDSAGKVVWNSTNQTVHATGGVTVQYGNVVMVADRVSVNQDTGETIADGRVRIQQGDQIWVGEHIFYNFLTKQLETEVFRTGKSPVFASAKNLHGDESNNVYSAESAFITTDDISDPSVGLRASSISIIPGKRITARNAVLYVGNVPILYLPYYTRSLGLRANNFNFVPGFRTRYGPFMLGTYNWFLGEHIDGALHADYRVQRGGAGGPDLNLHLGRWGEVAMKYYYLHDEDPGESAPPGLSIPENRQRVHISYDAVPFTNLNVKAMLRYQGDELLLHDFFESDYRRNPQPSTFIEVNKFWNNFSLDVYAQKRVNDFYETVERLPDVRLTGFRQQVGPTPFYYESETSLANLRRRFMETNPPVGLDYAAVRGDTYHQLTMPYNFFGWLNVSPRVGGRFTYYTDSWGEGGTNSQVSRGVFNTGVETTLKASRVWYLAKSSLLAVDGLRHIIEPSVNYVFVPTPNHRPMDLPQFDSELQSLRLLPIEYPDYNAIDAIDSQNVLRLGLRNRFQTKRNGEIEDLFFSEIYVDWRLNPRVGQESFSDIFSDAVFRPRTWLTLESQTRFSIENNSWRMLVHNLTLSPSDRWSLALGHWYLRDDLQNVPTALNEGTHLLRSTAFLKFNENWACRASHFYDLRAGRLQEQAYTVYRDFRSWTAGFTLRFRKSSTGQDDFSAGFTFSLKAAPRFSVGGDAVRPSQLLGY